MSRQCWSRALVAVVVSAGLVAFAGCGPSGSGLKTVKAKVKAVYDDPESTALPGDAMLQFHPEGTDATYVVAASIPTNGEFTLNTTLGQDAFDGAPPGKYKVTVMIGLGAVQVSGATPECQSAATTPLRVEISDAGVVSPNPIKVPKAKPQQ